MMRWASPADTAPPVSGPDWSCRCGRADNHANLPVFVLNRQVNGDEHAASYHHHLQFVALGLEPFIKPSLPGFISTKNDDSELRLVFEAVFTRRSCCVPCWLSTGSRAALVRGSLALRWFKTPQRGHLIESRYNGQRPVRPACGRTSLTDVCQIHLQGVSKNPLNWPRFQA